MAVSGCRRVASSEGATAHMTEASGAYAPYGPYGPYGAYGTYAPRRAASWQPPDESLRSASGPGLRLGSRQPPRQISLYESWGSRRGTGRGSWQPPDEPLCRFHSQAVDASTGSGRPAIQRPFRGHSEAIQRPTGSGPGRGGHQHPRGHPLCGSRSPRPGLPEAAGGNPAAEIPSRRHA